MLHGRTRESATVGDVVESARRSNGGALVVRGDPGVGKTALLEYGVRQADGFRVLRVSASPAERDVPFAALDQLVRPIHDGLGTLPPEQQAALGGALGLLAGTPAAPHLVALATLTLLSHQAAAKPLLIVVDDAQWLDADSGEAFRFVVRRLDAEPVALLAATTGAAPAGWTTGGREDLHVAGLDRDASDALVDDHARTLLPPSVRRVLWERTAGNPLALTETLGALSADQLAGREPITDLAAGVALAETLAARTGGFPTPTRALLLVAAAEGGSDLGVILRAAATMGARPADLDPAESAGVLSVDQGRLRFRHPLMRTAVYQAAPFGRRQDVHRALAAVLDAEQEPDRSAWHRAAAAVPPDDTVADELERAADRAAARGAHAAASSALARASDLTADPGHAGARMRRAAEAAWLAGNTRSARALAEAAQGLTTDPVEQAEVARIQGLVESVSGDRRVAFETLLAAATTVAREDSARAAVMFVDAGHIAWPDADVAGIVEVGRRIGALTLSDDAPEQFAAGLMRGLGLLLEGDTAAATPLLRAATEIIDPGDHQQLHIAGSATMFLGDDRAAARLLAAAAVRARAVGALTALPRTLTNLALVQLWSGDFTSAAAQATEAIAFAEETEQARFAAHGHAILAWIAAAQGRASDAVRHATDAIDVPAERRGRSPAALATWALALADLGAGRWSDALVRLDTLADESSALFHPTVGLLSTGDLVETAIRAETASLARPAIEKIDEFVGRSDSAWSAALAARSRALVASDDDALQEFERALEFHAASTRDFETARTQLLFGELLRRLRQRSEARMHLRRAAEKFERMGARPWLDRAQAELRATGETARRRAPDTLLELTPQQTQIVRLVAEGLTNKEVAAQLYVSPRTVDYHLRNVFTKLGITARAELIVLVRDGGAGETVD